MGLFGLAGSLIKTATDVAVVPLAVAADVVSLGENGHTEDALIDLGESIGEGAHEFLDIFDLD